MSVIATLRRQIAHHLHPPESYCEVCDPAWLHGKCDRCGIGRLNRVRGEVTCSHCRAVYDIKMKYAQ